jgi:citronellyl-CoA dehydrogenase
MWITNGMQADWCCLLANTSDGRRTRTSPDHGADGRPGITRQKIDKIGMDSAQRHRAAVLRQRARAQRNLIGQEGMGFMFQMLQFQEERLYGAAGSLRSLDRLIDQTIDYTRQRTPSASR